MTTTFTINSDYDAAAAAATIVGFIPSDSFVLMGVGDKVPTMRVDDDSPRSITESRGIDYYLQHDAQAILMHFTEEPDVTEVALLGSILMGKGVRVVAALAVGPDWTWRVGEPTRLGCKPISEHPRLLSLAVEEGRRVAANRDECADFGLRGNIPLADEPADLPRVLASALSQYEGPADETWVEAIGSLGRALSNMEVADQVRIDMRKWTRKRRMALAVALGQIEPSSRSGGAYIVATVAAHASGNSMLTEAVAEASGSPLVRDLSDFLIDNVVAPDDLLNADVMPGA